MAAKRFKPQPIVFNQESEGGAVLCLLAAKDAVAVLHCGAVMTDDLIRCSTWHQTINSL